MAGGLLFVVAVTALNAIAGPVLDRMRGAQGSALNVAIVPPFIVFVVVVAACVNANADDHYARLGD